MKKKAIQRRKLIGHVPVDSGMLMVVDPGHYSEQPVAYRELCLRMEAEGEYCALEEKIGNLPSPGVAVSSGYGDGLYPVYAVFEPDRFGRKGQRIIRLEVDMGFPAP